MLHHALGEDVHAEEAEVVARAEAGDNQFLLGNGGRRFLDHVGDVVESLASAHWRGCDGAVKGELALVCRLYGGNRPIGLGRDVEELAEAGFGGEGEIEVIAHHEEEGIIAGEIPGAEDGVPISPRLGLLDESDLIEVSGNGGGEVSFGAGGDDDGGRLDPAREDLIEEKSGDRFILAGWADERLKGKVLLVEASCRDDRFLNLHVRTTE